MRYGDILPVDFNIPTSAFWLRKDLETNPFKLLELRDGDVIMDCGSYIGTFAAACLEQGAAHVMCYEAMPKNAALLKGNMERYGERCTIVEGALNTTDAEMLTLTLSGFSGANSILSSPNRLKSIQVPGINFRRELLRIKPTVIKLDVEAAEYDLIESLEHGDMASIRAAFIEFHPIEDRDTRIATTRTYLRNEGGFRLLSERRRAFIIERQQ